MGGSIWCPYCKSYVVHRGPHYRKEHPEKYERLMKLREKSGADDR